MLVLMIHVNIKPCSLFNFLYLRLLYYFNFFYNRVSWLTTSTIATTSWGFRLQYRFGLLGDFHFRLIGCNKAVLVDIYRSGVLNRFGSLRWFIWRGNSLWPSTTLFTFTHCHCRWLDWRYECAFWWPHFHYLISVYALYLKHLCRSIILTHSLLSLAFSLFDVLNAVSSYCKIWGRHLSL